MKLTHKILPVNSNPVMMIAVPPKDAFAMYTQLKKSVVRYALHCECAGSYVHNGVVSFSEVYFFAEAINKLVRFIRRCETNRDYFIPLHEMNGLKKEMEFFVDKMDERIRTHCLSVMRKITDNKRSVTRIRFKFLVHEKEVLLYHPQYCYPCIKNSHVSEKEGNPCPAILIHDRCSGNFRLEISPAHRLLLTRDKEQLLVQRIFRFLFDAQNPITIVNE